ncbi:MAG: nitrophenyl compound nitroreductase subunit ArsF family protein [bacterium]
MKKTVLALLAVIVAAHLYMFPLQAEETTASKPISQVVVYYFHGTLRCPSCHLIEQYAKETVERDFAGQLSSGRAVFKIINVEEKGNEHFTNDYQLYTKSVVVSLVKNGKEEKWKNLKEVWPLLRNKEKFSAYVKDEVGKYLKEL